MSSIHGEGKMNPMLNKRVSDKTRCLSFGSIYLILVSEGRHSEVFYVRNGRTG